MTRPTIITRQYENKAAVTDQLQALQGWLSSTERVVTNDNYQWAKRKAKSIFTEHNLINLSQNELVELFEAVNAPHETSAYPFLSLNTQFPHKGLFSLSYSNATGTRHHCGEQIQLALVQRLIVDAQDQLAVGNSKNFFSNPAGQQRIHAVLTAKIHRVGFDHFSVGSDAPQILKDIFNTDAFNRGDSSLSQLGGDDGMSSFTAVRSCLYPR